MRISSWDRSSVERSAAFYHTAVRKRSPAGPSATDRQEESRVSPLPVVFDAQLVEGQAEGIEQVEHRLLDGLGEAQEQRPVFFDGRLARLDLPVLLRLDLQHLGHLLRRLAPALAMLLDQRSRLPGAGVGGL